MLEIIKIKFKTSKRINEWVENQLAEETKLQKEKKGSKK